jgi:hypothetical protein
MDILNWLFTQDQQLIKSTINNKNTDLIAMAADVSFDKRSDKWQTYAMTAVKFAPAIYDTANVTQTGAFGNAVTVNAHTGIITTVALTTAVGTEFGFIVNNNQVTTASKIFLSPQYSGTGDGFPAVHINAINNGSFSVHVINTGALALNNLMRIHFMIID